MRARKKLQRLSKREGSYQLSANHLVRAPVRCLERALVPTVHEAEKSAF